MSLSDELSRIILEDQEKDGSFLSNSVPVASPFGQTGRTHRTSFFTALIANCLANTDKPELMTAAGRAVDYLLTQNSPSWSFNYWARDSTEASQQPYPDDWDDTS